jgi:hypothetical protein
MAYGLQAFDNTGALILDISNKCGRIVKTLSVTVPIGADAYQCASGDLPTGLANDGSWQVASTSPDLMPVLGFSGSTPNVVVYGSSRVAVTVAITGTIIFYRY